MAAAKMKSILCTHEAAPNRAALSGSQREALAGLCGPELRRFET